MNAKQINIFTGNDLQGHWFALSLDIPWLTAESESFGTARKTVTDIATRLASLHGIEGPIEFVWHSIDSGSQNGQ